MIIWTIQISIVSIIFIVLVHHLIYYFRDILTIPKTKYMVQIPDENICNIISNSNTKNNQTVEENNNNMNNNNINDIENMKDELRNFIQNNMRNDYTSTSY